MTDGRAGSGGGDRRPQTDEERAIVVHEEEARADKRWEGTGYARIRRVVDREPVDAEFPYVREELVHERIPVDADDSGQIERLPDGSISIPLFEEELVVTRQTVLRERVIIRKEAVTEVERVETELRRERIEFDAADVPADQIENGIGEPPA
jgi:uncharacterized protein (TIGR02271 family)